MNRAATYLMLAACAALIALDLALLCGVRP